ncbi:broad-complex core protein isoforms 1/2/3/4/5-like isoform X1 [Amphibalanus amphitrite]|uniref:broad-complex core protein isoforms 1/2/3/4/5-like isoform X1 n=1 Tax=Amphibalanus amphitrite TaxID=1232801 RepID=UPI001C90D9AD|nr:broad-complex core protein isoforms 1/2/3/4/5-like isoform X1 [Amphibalanus amphitrite]
MAPGNDAQGAGKFCLKWDGFHSNLTSVFETLRQGEELVDITLCCEGKKLKAHKMMLSAASPFFRDLLQENPCQHPVFVLRDTRCQDMAAIIEFVYRGSVNVSQAQLASFIQTAELLQIRGLSGDEDAKQRESRPPSVDAVPTEPPPMPAFRGSNRRSASPPGTPQRYRPAPGGRPEPTTPPAKRRRPSAASPPPPPAVLAAPPEPPGAPPPLPDLHEPVVKQEKFEESDEVQVYESSVPPGLEQMIFAPQQYPRAMNSSTGSIPPTPATGVNSSEDSSQGSTRSGHTCPVCGQRYWSLASLHNHVSLHRGTTVCPVCSKICSTTSNRNRHMANKHGVQIGWRNGGPVVTPIASATAGGGVSSGAAATGVSAVGDGTGLAADGAVRGGYPVGDSDPGLAGE